MSEIWRPQTYKRFVNNPLSPDQGVQTLPGIGPAYGGRLRDSGITTAQQLLGQYLMMNRNRGVFMSWLWGICILYPQSPTANRDMNWCCDALREWSDRHIFTSLNRGLYCSYGTITRVTVMGIEITINGPVIEPLNKGYPFCPSSSWSCCPVAVY